MLAIRSPQEAYRRVDFDARVEGAHPEQLVALCYEQLVSAIGTTIFAQERGDNALKSQSLTRALSAVTALQLGIDDKAAMARALRQFYEGTRRALLDSAVNFDADKLAAIRQDFIEIASALRTPR